MDNPTSNLEVGYKVEVNGAIGCVRYIGNTEFASGKWVGIELEGPDGKNNGSVQGKVYFTCPEKYGIFVRPSLIKKIISTGDSILENNNAAIANPSAGSSPRVAHRSTTPTKRESVKATDSPAGRSPLIRSGSPKGDIATAIPKPSPRSESRRSTLDSVKQPAPETKQLPEDSPKKVDASISKVEVKKEEEKIPPADISLKKPDAIKEVVSADTTKVDPATAQNLVAITKEFEELKLKYKVLEARKLEDREKIREGEKLKMKLDEALALNEKSTIKISSLQQEIKDIQRQLKEKTDSHEEGSLDKQDLMEQLEMLTLDKEMAEEKAESFQHELEILKEQLEEATLDLEILRKEKERKAQHPKITTLVNETSSKPEISQSDYIQMEKHNERLKEALIKLRDVSAAEEAEKNNIIKDLEKQNAQLKSIANHYESCKLKLEEAEVHIEELKLNLELAVESQDMIEKLTDKNLNLEEQVNELKGIVEELEDLKEVHGKKELSSNIKKTDELEEQHIETEKIMQKQIDELEQKMSSQKQVLESKEGTISEYEGAIMQYKDLVRQLQDELKQLRSIEREHENINESFTSQSQTMMDLNLKLQSSVLKNQAKQIELELQKIQLLLQNENMKIRENYLPESFFGQDQGAVAVLLVLMRIYNKGNIILNVMNEVLVPDDQVKIKQQIMLIQAYTESIYEGIENETPETFLKLKEKQDDVALLEKKFDELIEGAQKGLQAEKSLHKSLSMNIEILKALREKLTPGAYINLMKPYVVNDIHKPTQAKLKILTGKMDELSQIYRIPEFKAIHESLNQFTKESDDSFIENLNKLLNQAMEVLEEREKLEKKKMSVDLPWRLRGKELKSEFLLNQELQVKMRKTTDECYALMKDIQSKQQIIQEYEVKVALMENKLLIINKQNEEIESLRKKIEGFQDNERSFEETMENLHSENEKLEMELAKLKKATGVVPEVVDESPLISDIKKSTGPIIEKLKSEISRLKSKDLVQQLDELEPIHIVDNTKQLNASLNALQRDIQRMAVTTKLVSLKGDNKTWRSLREDPQYELERQRNHWKQLDKRREKILNEAIQDTRYEKQAKESKRDSLLFGKISLPYSTQVNHKIVLDYSEMHNLHQLMV